MKFGLCTFPCAYSLPPGELGREAEDRGYESVWFSEHSHIPASRRTPWPGGADLPQMYYDVMDPIVSLTAVAATTTHLRLGTGIALVAQRDPIQLAKELATLDVLSGGRVEFGVGGGWNAEEMEHHGTAFADRWIALRERVEAIRTIWTDDVAEYHGRTVDFDPIIQNPKPIQRPHPRIHIGGAVPGGPRRAIQLGDGWIPLTGRGDQDFTAHAAQFRSDAAAAGRDPASLEITIFATRPDAANVQSLAAAGVDRVTFFVPTTSPADARWGLDLYQELVDEYR